MIEAVIQDIKLKIRKNRPDVFHGFQLQELPGVDVYHESLKPPKIVTVETVAAWSGLAIPNFLEQGGRKLPPDCVVRDDNRLPVLRNHLRLAGDFPEAKAQAVFLNGALSALGVVCVDHLVKRLKVITEHLRVRRKALRSRFLVAQTCKCDRRPV